MLSLFIVVVTYSLIDYFSYFSTLAFDYWDPFQHLSCPKSCCFQYGMGNPHDTFTLILFQNHIPPASAL